MIVRNPDPGLCHATEAGRSASVCGQGPRGELRPKFRPGLRQDRVTGRLSPPRSPMGGPSVSHIVTIEVETRDPAAVAAACRRLGLPEPATGTAKLFEGEATGLLVKLPGWLYPAVVEPVTGKAPQDMSHVAVHPCVFQRRTVLCPPGAKAWPVEYPFAGAPLHHRSSGVTSFRGLVGCEKLGLSPSVSDALGRGLDTWPGEGPIDLHPISEPGFPVPPGARLPAAGGRPEGRDPRAVHPPQPGLRRRPAHLLDVRPRRNMTLPSPPR